MVSPENSKRDAFTLFEGGEYERSYALCRELQQFADDPAISVLCAANLFHMGRHEEAEAFFRDLSHSLPGASHVHSYLGRILELKGDDGALAEYARAVALDPGNLEALRCFASFVLRSGDPGKAVPVFSHLYSRSHRADDARLLARALFLSGRPSDALEVWEHVPGGRLPIDEDYISILLACGRFGQVAEFAWELYERSGKPLFARKYLEALVRTDRQRARAEYPRFVEMTGDRDVRYDYAGFLKDEGDFEKALSALGPLLLDGNAEGKHLLMECELLALLQERGAAVGHFRKLLERELDSMADPGFIQDILASYRIFLQTHHPFREAEAILLASLSTRTDPFSLLTVARFYEDAGDLREARSWYYRAYRSDSVQGGPPYAWFCYRTGDIRECEKVMIYVAGTARKVSDLLRLTEFSMREKGALLQMPRLLERLKTRLEEFSEILPLRGRELLAVVCHLYGSVSLEKGDSISCKRSCLEGLDVIPRDAKDIRPTDFLTLIEECKTRSLSEIPVLPHPENREAGVPEPPDISLFELDLDENERKILEFLRTRHQASEMELRVLLGSRRVSGMVNRILQKASSKGLVLIEKRGVGKDGEIYAYRNT